MWSPPQNFYIEVAPGRDIVGRSWAIGFEAAFTQLVKFLPRVCVSLWWH